MLIITFKRHASFLRASTASYLFIEAFTLKKILIRNYKRGFKNSDPKIGICKFCRKMSVLRRSHSINDCLFNSITSKYTGKMRALSDGLGFGRNEEWQNSGWDHLLCQNCESFFNENFDKYGASFLKDVEFEFKENEFISKSLDPYKLQKYIISIIWRCAISQNEMYIDFDLPEFMKIYLEKCLRGLQDPFQELTIKIEFLSINKCLKTESDKEIIIPPTNETIPKNPPLFITSMCLCGVYIEMFWGNKVIFPAGTVFSYSENITIRRTSFFENNMYNEFFINTITSLEKYPIK